MEIKINYNYKDYEKANNIHYSLLFMKPIYLLFKLLIIYLALVQVGTIYTKGFSFYSAFWLFFSLNYIFPNLIILKIAYRISFKKQKMLQNENTIQIFDDYIIENTGISESKFTEFEKIVITNETILLYNTRVTFIIIPRRALNEIEFERVISIVKEFKTSKLVNKFRKK